MVKDGELIKTADELAVVCKELEALPYFAIDTEFESERSYWPRVQLIQLGTPSYSVLVDPLEIKDLSCLWNLIANPKVMKITHAGRQDAEIFFNQSGLTPQNLYDTQIAAALLGMGEQIGYANLVSRVLNQKIKKTERVTDWSRRPLSDAQRDYALGDVIYLPEIYEFLTKELRKLEREDWLKEELAFFEKEKTYQRDPRKAFLRVSGKGSLDRRGMGILRELACWREETAAQRNEPRGRVMSDDVLVELALRKPTTLQDMHPLRRLRKHEIENHGPSILEAVARGVGLKDSELPVPPRGLPEDPQLTLIAHLMDVVVRLRGSENKIAPAYLSNQRGIRGLVDWLAGRIPKEKTPRLVQGWRHQIVGKDLVDLYEGKIKLHVDTDSQRIAILPAAAPVTVED